MNRYITKKFPIIHNFYLIVKIIITYHKIRNKMNRFHAERIKSSPTSIFSTMTMLAYKYKAVNLGQGFPDFDGPDWIMKEAFKAMQSGHNQYAPTQGIHTLRKQLSDIHSRIYDLKWDYENEITVTAGATEALYSTITALINPGDEVIMFEPFYDAHQANVLLAGGIPKYITLKKPDFSFSFDEFEQAISPKTKMIIINSPHNPTGKCLNTKDLKHIADLAIKHDLIVISDEVYEFLTYDGTKHIPMASIDGMQDRTIMISSTGKTFGMTGWKIGFAFASKSLTEAIRKVHQWTTFAVNTPGQHAMAHAFSRLNEYLPDFISTYEKKRNLIYEGLKSTRFTPFLPKGSYFIMVNIPDGPYSDDVEAAKWLVEKHGIATIPPSVFYGNSSEGKTMLRLCFAKSDDTIKAGVERLADASK